MKQFKLRKQESFIQILKEPPKKKKKINGSRIIYLCIAIFAGLYLINKVVKANLNIYGNGQIELPKQTVKFSNDIKVLELYISEGQEVCEADTLFSYQIMGDELDQARLSVQSPTSGDWIIREKLNLKKKIKLNQLLIQQKNLDIKYLDELLKSKENLLLNGIHDEYDNYASLKDKQAQLKSDIAFHQEEIKVLKKHLGILNFQDAQYAKLDMGLIGIYDKVSYFIAPHDGVISDIFYAVNEICYKKDEMITIHQLTNTSITSYFDQEEAKHLNIGDVVEIEFPDKSRTKGFISKFYVSTYAIPSEFQKKYEPTERNIVAEVLPLYSKEQNNWSNFYKMGVKVLKKRYEL